MRRDIKYEFWEENEVVIQEILERLENLKKWILTVSNSVSKHLPWKRKSRRFYLRIYHVFYICVLNNRPPVSEHQTRRKGLWPSRFPKPGNSITFYVSFCQAWEKCLGLLQQRPLLSWKKVSWWQFNKTTEFATWEFFFEKRSSWP